MASGDLYSWVILTMNKFRAGHRVEIPQFSREQIRDVDLIPGFPYKSATFTVRGTAYYHDLGKFVADFENTYPYIRLVNLELDPVAASASSGAKAVANPEDQEKISFKMEPNSPDEVVPPSFSWATSDGRLLTMTTL